MTYWKIREEKAKQYVQSRNFSKQANAELRLYNATMKINRLELLKANIGLEMIDSFNQMQGQFDANLLKRAADEFSRQAGILGMGVDKAPKMARAIVNASFHNADFSTRIWANQGQLRNELSILLSNGIVQGIHSRELAKQIEKKFGVSKSNAERLMRTEMARVQIAAQEESYRANGYEQYVFLVIGTACPGCLALNEQHFNVADMQSGENAPPMHPNCRCSTAAWMDRAETMKQIKAMSQVNGVAKSMNTGQSVQYDANKDYYMDIPNISEDVKKAISECAREVAKEGSLNGYEYAYIVDLESGAHSSLLTDKEWGSVRPDYSFLKLHKNVIFIHNHNTDTELSFPDVSLVANDPEINMVAAVRNDGIITLVKSNGKKTDEYLPLKYSDSGDYDRITLELKNSKNLEVERELKLRDLTIDEYCEGGIQKYGYE